MLGVAGVFGGNLFSGLEVMHERNAHKFPLDPAANRHPRGPDGSVDRLSGSSDPFHFRSALA
jgi:hypothetical protein